jgi:hypothetical protein
MNHKGSKKMLNLFVSYSENDKQTLKVPDFVDVCTFFCSKEAQNNCEMCEEVNLAFNTGLEIIPIYQHFSDIFPIIRHKRGVKIAKNKFNPQDVAKKVIKIVRDGKKFS